MKSKSRYALIVRADWRRGWPESPLRPLRHRNRKLTVIRAGTLIDPRADEPKHNQVIVIRGDRIEAWAMRRR